MFFFGTTKRKKEAAVKMKLFMDDKNLYKILAEMLIL